MRCPFEKVPFPLLCLVSLPTGDGEASDDAKSDNEDEDPIQRYKKLLEDIEKKDEKKSNKDMEMEISWGIGIKDKAEELVKKKQSEGMFRCTYLNTIIMRMHNICLWIVLRTRTKIFFLINEFNLISLLVLLKFPFNIR